MKNMMQFLQDVKIEMTKVVWPKFDEFIGSTIIVLVLVCAFAIYLGSIDFVFSKFARYIFKLYGGY
ncbi:MAG TPA: preprotein translocase subunit SecE [Candidatus Dependentiae bacterium]|nr:preprotein translocase subunit SecE [Candidatus Dependentiae bacterium]